MQLTTTARFQGVKSNLVQEDTTPVCMGVGVVNAEPVDVRNGFVLLAAAEPVATAEESVGLERITNSRTNKRRVLSERIEKKEVRGIPSFHVIEEWQGHDIPANGQAWIRQFPGLENGGASQLLRNICLEKPKISSTNLRSLGGSIINCRMTTHYSVTEIITWLALVLKFAGATNFGIGDPDGLRANLCWPKVLIDDLGWALLTNDERCNNHPDWNKRDLEVREMDDFDTDDIVLFEGSSTRKTTDEELREQSGFHRWVDAECSSENQALGIESAMICEVGRTMSATITATTTTGVTAPALTSTWDTRVTGAVFLQITEMPTRPKLKQQ
ncbi:hypothetical protein BDZ45DRAFT_728079 [Acephala macrosclerotiorum]|nr:hypothetical protein BDZ45DRAFT_728079 [Acephala macrosclerotiorum]